MELRMRRKTLSRKWPAMYRDRPRDSQLNIAAGFGKENFRKKTGRTICRRRAPAMEKTLRNPLAVNGLGNPKGTRRSSCSLTGRGRE
jgi:hypothetical protein